MLGEVPARDVRNWHTLVQDPHHIPVQAQERQHAHSVSNTEHEDFQARAVLTEYWDRPGGSYQIATSGLSRESHSVAFRER
ncbi:hypothetical protein Kisp01_70030 [Kineosporia sp. NBRC 101677]|nr:hypothetical protein Kisp01_70030 [Kineosporia sp. NBRC 101677]